MRKPLILLCLLVTTLGTVVGQPVTIDIGEQPPLLTKNGGIVNQVVAQALARSGYEVTFQWYPIGRMLMMLENDTSSVYVTPSNTAGQQNPHVFLLSAQGVFFYKKSHPVPQVTRLEDLAGQTVGTVVNSPLRARFEKAGIIVDEGPFETMFDKLDLGRVDFVSTADVGGILTIKAKFPGREAEFDFTDFSYTEIKTGLYVQDKPELRRILDACRAGFAKIKEDGTLNRLLREFFGAANYRRVKVY